MKMHATKGFTLIELLVVISIVGLLSSIVFASLSNARVKADDAKRISDYRNIKSALELYYDKYNRYPPSPNNFPYDHRADFIAVANALVSEGFLKSVPYDPSDPTSYYQAYDYGKGSTAGLIIVFNLQSIPNSTTGPYNSCRPFTNNWCASNIASKNVCLCNRY